MSRLSKSVEEKNPFELVEEAFYLLRRAPASALVGYYLGALPFVLGLLFFWSDMARSAFAEERLLPGSLALTVGFLWMKTWQAVFGRSLHACLCGEPPPAWSGGRLLSTAVYQACFQPAGLFLLPVCLLVMVPFGWAYAFFSNVTVLCGGENPTALGLARRAWRQAMVWPMLNHNLLFILTLFSLLVFVNLYSAVLGIPLLIDRLLGVESIFSQAPWAAMNSTLTAAIAGLTYLCCDPLVKTVYVLRCFYGESLRTGQDLKAELRGFERQQTGPMPVRPAGSALQLGKAGQLSSGPVGPAALLLLIPCLLALGAAAAEPAPELEARGGEAQARPPNSVSAPALQQSIDQIIQQREYSWRLPRETAPKNENEKLTWFEYFHRKFQEALKAAGRWAVDLVRWLINRLTRGTPRGSGTALAFAVKALVVLLAAALLGFLAWLLWRLWRSRDPRPELSATPLAPAPDLTDENTGAERLPEEGWLQLASELLSRGELRLALRAFYLATLAHLAQRGLIVLARFKSNHDYENELHRRGHALADLLGLFTQNRLVFERVWYGRDEVTPRALHEFADTVERIKRS